MFSGIIEKLAQLHEFEVSNNKSYIAISMDNSDLPLKIGDSVAINGVCLTIAKIKNHLFYYDLSPETLSLTSFNDLSVNDFVNVEFPLTLNKFISGHITTGHVDTIGVIKSLKKIIDSWEVVVEVKSDIDKYIIHKGSITIDGVSLTVNKLDNNLVYLMIIPHTFENTIFKYYKIGQKVNIEVDYITKHLEKLKND
jgi:riboflavin synthase|tara:strand:+ start:1004 stop:1591 length:588 start_codon:yes stop_codon:yes gene_type:complete